MLKWIIKSNVNGGGVAPLDVLIVLSGTTIVLQGLLKSGGLVHA